MIANFLRRPRVPVSRVGSSAWLPLLLSSVGILTAGSLAGCAPGSSLSGAAATVGSNSSASAPPVSHVTTGLKGLVHGGQFPIVGSLVTLYAAGQPASASPVMLGSPVTTGENGTFSFASVGCKATDLVYVVAQGGNSGGGSNSAIGLMAALGPCGSIPSSIVINELTTVAAVYALNAFSNAPLGGGVSGCVDCTAALGDMTQLHGTPPAINNSFATAALLANVTTGGPGIFLPSAANCTGNGQPVNCGAVQKLTGLANSLAACINSTTTAGTCAYLMTDAAGTPGNPIGISPPIDTLQATLAIARYPGLVNIAPIYRLANPHPVFAPGLAVAPNDWTIALNFTGGGMPTEQPGGTPPGQIAIDALGDAWIANPGNNSLTELSPTGVPVFTSGITGGGLNVPLGIAIDVGGNVWVTNQSGNTVSAFTSNGDALQTTAAGLGGLASPTGIAIDPHGNIWVGNGSGGLTELSALGQSLGGSRSASGGLGPSSFLELAIDAKGHVWVADYAGNDVAEFNAAGLPVAAAGFASGDLAPVGIAVGASGRVWVANDSSPTIGGTGNVTGLVTGNDGAVLLSTSSFTGGGLAYPTGLALDGADNIWIVGVAAADFVPVVTEFTSGGTPLSPSTGFTGGGLFIDINGTPSGIAIDGSGDVWVTNLFGSVTEFIGAAVPVVTPLVAQITPPPVALTSIAVTPVNPGVTAGSNQQFIATGTYANNAIQNLTGTATWTSSNPSVATIAAGGLATAVAAGTTIITATVTQDGATILGSTQLTVTGATTGTTANTLAIAAAGQIQLFNVSSSWASAGSAPTPFATLSAPGVTSVAFDKSNNLYYLAPVGASSVSFTECAAPAYSSCTTVGASLPAAAEWLAIDTSGNGYVTESSTVIEFPLASGPSASSSVVYTSSVSPSPAGFTGLAVSSGPSPTLYVVEGGGYFGTGNKLFQCSVPCGAGQQANITSQVLSASQAAPIGISGTVFGPIAVGPAPASSLYVALGDAAEENSGVTTPTAQPIALICPSTIGTSGACVAGGFAFPAVAGSANQDPFVASVGIAVDSNGNAYVAVALDSPVSAPYFFGFQPNGSALGCSGTTGTCPLNLLPSLPTLSPASPFLTSSFLSLPYAMAIGPAGS